MLQAAGSRSTMGANAHEIDWAADQTTERGIELGVTLDV